MRPAPEELHVVQHYWYTHGLEKTYSKDIAISHSNTLLHLHTYKRRNMQRKCPGLNMYNYAFEEYRCDLLFIVSCSTMFTCCRYWLRPMCAMVRCKCSKPRAQLVQNAVCVKWNRIASLLTPIKNLAAQSQYYLRTGDESELVSDGCLTSLYRSTCKRFACYIFRFPDQGGQYGPQQPWGNHQQVLPHITLGIVVSRRTGGRISTLEHMNILLSIYFVHWLHVLKYWAVKYDMALMWGWLVSSSKMWSVLSVV